MIIRHPRTNISSAGSTAVFTPLFSSAFNVTTINTWEDKDLFTDLSVPKGAIAIILALTTDGNYRHVGIRTDGSAVDRRLQEMGIGNSTPFNHSFQLPVKVDETTGLIEVYAETTTVNFHCLGYWAGIDFTEAWDALTVASDSTWTDKNLNSLHSVPLGAVAMMACASAQTSSKSIGCRTDGSSLVRTYPMRETTNSAVAKNALTLPVKVDSSTGIVELFAEDASDAYFYHAGYFDSGMDFTELKQSITAPSTDDTWEDTDLTSYLDQDGRVVDVVCGNGSTGTSYIVGIRENGSSNESKFSFYKTGDTAGSIAGFSQPLNSDGSGIIEIYAENKASSVHELTGYYK